jgi:Protein of unknown function (DUF1348)
MAAPAIRVRSRVRDRYCTIDLQTSAHPHSELGMSPRPPLPPFTPETASQKARLARTPGNSRDPQSVALAFTEDSRWRNRVEFIAGRAAIIAFLERKWTRELDYHHPGGSGVSREPDGGAVRI